MGADAAAKKVVFFEARTIFALEAGKFRSRRLEIPPLFFFSSTPSARARAPARVCVRVQVRKAEKGNFGVATSKKAFKLSCQLKVSTNIFALRHSSQ